MKKSRLAALLLTLVLCAGLLSPYAALAAGAEPTPEPSPAPTTQVTTGTGEAVSELMAGMTIDGTAALLMDQATGTVLLDQNGHERRFPASITKVMTALLCVEAIDRGELSKDQVIVVGPEVSLEVGAGSSTQNIKQGEEMRLEDVLYCALTASANEACNVIAQAASGNVADFVALMNQRAAELGMKDTHFANTHGYHNENHYTTAYDIALMCREAMQHELFRTIVSSKDHTVPATNLHDQRELHETNALVSNFRYVGYFYPYATGIKTGSTPEAGLCLASSASKDGTDLISVVLGCVREPDTTGSQGMTQFSESRRLLEWGFSSFEEKAILDSTGFYYEVPVTLSSEVNYVGVEPSGSISEILPKDLDPAEFKKEATLTQATVAAPIEKGQVLGTITVSNGGTVYGTLDLVAVADVERSELLYRLDQIKQFFSQLWVRIALIVLAVVIAILVLRWLIFGRRRRYGRRNSGGGSRGYTGRRRR